MLPIKKIHEHANYKRGVWVVDCFVIYWQCSFKSIVILSRIPMFYFRLSFYQTLFSVEKNELYLHRLLQAVDMMARRYAGGPAPGCELSTSSDRCCTQRHNRTNGWRTLPFLSPLGGGIIVRFFSPFFWNVHAWVKVGCEWHPITGGNYQRA